MADYPPSGLGPTVTINPRAPDSVGVQLIGTNVGSPASTAWPSANLAIFVPFVLARPFLVVKMFIKNGTPANGNTDLGIYDSEGTKLVSSGSTARSGATQFQEFDIADTLIGPGQFYMAAAHDGTGNFFSYTWFSLQVTQVFGLFDTATSFALPATVTFRAATVNYVPQMGLTGRVVV